MVITLEYDDSRMKYCGPTCHELYHLIVPISVLVSYIPVCKSLMQHLIVQTGCQIKDFCLRDKLKLVASSKITIFGCKMSCKQYRRLNL